MKATMAHYSGNVQGVGFRATAVIIARAYPVAGWVRNLPNGGVQLLAEGPADAVNQFLQAIREEWTDEIDQEHLEDQTPAGTFATFEIKG